MSNTLYTQWVERFLTVNGLVFLYVLHARIRVCIYMYTCITHDKGFVTDFLVIETSHMLWCPTEFRCRYNLYYVLSKFDISANQELLSR